MLVNQRNPDLQHLEFDNDASLREAMARKPFERVIEEFGHAPRNGKWASMDCPFCKRKSKAGLFTAPDGARLFKCHSTKCVTGAEALDVVGFIAQQTGYSRRDAFIEYLKMTDVWKERSKFPKRQAAPENFDRPARSDNGSRAMDAKGETSAPDVARPPRDERRDDLVPHGALSDVEQNQNDFPPAEGGPAPEMPIAQAAPTPVRENLAAADALAATDDARIESAAASDPEHPALPPVGGEGKTENELPEERKNLDSCPPATSAASGPPSETSNAPADNSSAPTAAEEKKAEELPPGLRALRLFYARLGWEPKDGEMIFRKRGLTETTCALMGFRSNPRANEAVLQSLLDDLGWDELVAAGLALPADRKRRKEQRLNQQFFGKGITGKKPEADRRDKADKWLWGWCAPVLIPYFDERGALVKLRPHKGGAPGTTLAGAQRIYVPRVLGELAEEVFPTVVICEGEFKAVALWQVLGKGALRNGFVLGSDPIGVCALPGISFSRSEDMRSELEEWLRSVKCRRVIVAFDDEDKSDKELSSRYDAQIYARYLAQDLTRRIGVNGEVLVLPREWRDAKGKSDWDGALAKMIQTKANDEAF